jgi:alpha-amylase/alpha-mannosidase (GH57 family)
VDRYICIHGHFYQPPRENPWLEAIELQDSAYPYHDWNERITAECYAPNAASRILDVHGRIVRIVNNYSNISYNVGPTLLAWLEQHAPDTYRSIIDADAQSQQRFGGHGSALAQPYNHMIMPLANAEDRSTQVIWGIRDFRKRFNREPAGMWLPETAVDIPTLEVLAAQGIGFTVLAPHQAARVRPLEGGNWRDVGELQVDTTRPYLQRLPSGRAIALFFYDTTVSRAVAFEGLLKNGEIFAQRLLTIFGNQPGPQLGHIATDGETYGHHHRHGDMALAYALYHIESQGLAKLTNYAQFLELFPPQQEVQIHEHTSWSCAHGTGRWQNDCGCRTGGRADSSQKWRKPLREGLDWLRDQVREPFEARAAELLHDPWAARDDYIQVILDRSDESVDDFLKRHGRSELTNEQQVQALKLLELQRHAMLMYTSCGWFFHDLAGIETVQVLRYTGRALQLAREALGRDLEEGFLERITEARSNDPQEGGGRDIYERYVRPSSVDLEKVAAHQAVSSLYEEQELDEQVYSYRVSADRREKLISGDAQMVLGRAYVFSTITRERATTTYALLYFGDHHVHGGYRSSGPVEAYESLVTELRAPFLDRDFPTVVRRLDRQFQQNTFSFKSLFSDTQRRILDKILESTLTEAEAAYRELYRHHAPLMRFMSELRLPLPEAFKTTAEYVLNTDLRRTVTREPIDMERVRDLLEEVRSAQVELDVKTVGYAIERSMERVARQLAENPEDQTLLETLEALATTARSLAFDIDVWQVQNIYFDLMKLTYPRLRVLAAVGETRASEWVSAFMRLGEQLAVSVDQGSA